MSVGRDRSINLRDNEVAKPLEFADLDKGKRQAHRQYSIWLTAVTIVIWFVVTYVAVFFSPRLNTIVNFGFPLGYYLGAQGSLVIFMILIFNYALRVNKADAGYGVDGESE